MKTTFLLIISVVFLSLGSGILAQEIELPNPGLTPDSPFYFLETIIEEIVTFFTFGDLRKAERYTAQAAERLAEAQAVIEKGKPEFAEKTLQRYESQLNKGITLAKEAQDEGQNAEKIMEVVTKIGKTTTTHLEILAGVYEKVSDEVKSSVENTMKVLVKGHEKAVEILKAQNALGEIPEEAPISIGVPAEVRERIQTGAQQELEIEKVLESIDSSKSLREICAEEGGTPEMCEEFPLEKFESFEQIKTFCIEKGGPAEICSSLETMCREYGVTTPNECFLLLSVSSIKAYSSTAPTMTLQPEIDPDCPQGHVTHGQTKHCCEDSDLNASYGQGYYYIKGTVECKIIDTTDGILISHEINTDSCDGDRLTEWTYDGSHQASFEKYDCPQGCEDGVCMGTAPAYEGEGRINYKEESATTEPAYLGVRSLIIMDTDAQEREESPTHYGAMLISPEGKDAVIPGSPAALAGLKEGDIILEFQGDKLTINNTLTEMIYSTEPDTNVSLKVLRGEEEFTVDVRLIEKPADLE